MPYSVICLIIGSTACLALIAAYTYLGSLATTRGERTARKIEIVLLCAILTIFLISFTGLADHLQPV